MSCDAGGGRQRPCRGGSGESVILLPSFYPPFCLYLIMQYLCFISFLPSLARSLTFSTPITSSFRLILLKKILVYLKLLTTTPPLFLPCSVFCTWHVDPVRDCLSSFSKTETGQPAQTWFTLSAPPGSV